MIKKVILLSSAVAIANSVDAAAGQPSEYSGDVSFSLSAEASSEPVPIDQMIEGWEQDNIVHYAISDNGIGIDPKFEKAIFEPLHRLHGANSVYKGQGIGLWLTANIVSAHGGEIALDTSYDQGARFVFKLPK